MAGRGPTPKLGAKLGHTKAQPAVAPGDGLVKNWPVPAAPSDEGWTVEAVEWWEQAVASPSSTTWTAFEHTKLHRLLVMVDHWWRLAARGSGEAGRLHDIIRRAEEELYLSPRGRAQAGIAPPVPGRAGRVAQGGSRARLRTVDTA